MSNMAQTFTQEQQQTISEAVKKINKEAESVSGQQVPAIAIYNFLIDRCRQDPEFSAKVLIETKKLSKCFDHIMTVAYNRAQVQRKVTTGNRVGVGMSSEEIFALVEDYFNLDDEAIAKKEAEDKAKSEAKAKADAAAKAADDKSKKPQKTQKPKAEEDPQLSLF